MYKWFVPKGGFVFDPFVGGCCAGIVASKLGYKYLGTDIRPEQVEANNEQAQRICKTNTPKYVVCDARSSAKVVKPESLDCIYSCPPYVDLEQYSNDPQDISTLKWDKFEPEYSGIIESVVTRLKLNRFAIFVVGEVRGKDGNCVGFVPGTINAFQRAGLHLYNDAIRLTMLGSLSIRAGRPFNATRKLGRTHQHVLIFLKGSADKAVAAIKESGN